MSERTGPLSDVTVVDCTMALAGPFGTGLLGDLGESQDPFRYIPEVKELNDQSEGLKLRKRTYQYLSNYW